MAGLHIRIQSIDETPRPFRLVSDAAFWEGHKQRILAGHVLDVFPYDPHKRFRRALPAPAVA